MPQFDIFSFYDQLLNLILMFAIYYFFSTKNSLIYFLLALKAKIRRNVTYYKNKQQTIQELNLMNKNSILLIKQL